MFCEWGGICMDFLRIDGAGGNKNADINTCMGNLVIKINP